MEEHQPRLLKMWMEAVKKITSKVQLATFERRVQQSTKDREIQFGREEAAIKQSAFGRFREHLKAGNGQLSIKISRMMRTSDGTSVNITWSEEVEKEPTKVIRMFQLGTDDPAQISAMGTMKFEPGVEIRKLATVKMGQVVAFLVKENNTIVRRIQFPTQVDLKAQQSDVQAFPRACSLCSVRANDRRVAFLFGVKAGRLGTVAFCRFNEAFTSVDVTLSIDMDASFGLTGPLLDILLTERSLCAVDGSGDVQSFDIRTHRTSTKVSCGKSEVDDDDKWVSGLLSFADELVVGRTKIDGNKRLCVRSISNEDHLALPSVVLGLDLPSTELAVGSMGDVVYVVNASEGTIYSSELSVTVRSDAYRIQRSGNGAKTVVKGVYKLIRKGKVLLPTTGCGCFTTYSKNSLCEVSSTCP